MNENESGSLPEKSAVEPTNPVNPTASDPKQSTDELIEAVKKLVQSEMRAAGEFTRETYIKAVSRAKETIEKIRLIDQAEIEASFQNLESKAEQNWKGIVEDLADFGDRIADAARAAWQVLTEPRDKDEPPKE